MVLGGAKPKSPAERRRLSSPSHSCTLPRWQKKNSNSWRWKCNGMARPAGPSRVIIDIAPPVSSAPPRQRPTWSMSRCARPPPAARTYGTAWPGSAVSLPGSVDVGVMLLFSLVMRSGSDELEQIALGVGHIRHGAGSGWRGRAWPPHLLRAGPQKLIVHGGDIVNGECPVAVALGHDRAVRVTELARLRCGMVQELKAGAVWAAQQCAVDARARDLKAQLLRKAERVRVPGDHRLQV